MRPVRANGNFASSTFTLVSSVPITFDWNSVSFSVPYSGFSNSAQCANQPPMVLRGDIHTMALEDLLLPVQGQMVRRLGHNHLRQQTGACRALLDRLRRLGRRLHGAGARILSADVLGDGQLRRNVFVALAGFF